MDGRIGIGNTANRDAVIIETARAGGGQHQHRFGGSDGKYIHGFKTVALAILAPQDELMSAVFQSVQGNIAAAAPGDKVAVIQCIGAVLQLGIGRHLDGHIRVGNIIHAVHGFLTGGRQRDFRFLSRYHGNGRRFHLVRGKKTAVIQSLEGTYTHGIRFSSFQTIGKRLGLYHRLGGSLFRVSFGSGGIPSAHGHQSRSLVHLHIPVNGRLAVFIVDGDQITVEVTAGCGHSHVNGVIAAQCGTGTSGSIGGVGVGIGNVLLLCDGIGSAIRSGAHRADGVSAGGHIGRIGQRNFAVIHLSQSLCIALIQNEVFAIVVIGINGQSAQRRQVACNRSGGAVYRDALQFRETGHTVDAQLGCAGSGDLHFLTKILGFRHGEGDAGRPGFGIEGHRGVGIGVGRIIGRLGSIHPNKRIGRFSTADGKDALCLLQRAGRELHRNECVLSPCLRIRQSKGCLCFCAVVGDDGVGKSALICHQRHIKGFAAGFIGINRCAEQRKGLNGRFGSIILAQGKLHIAAPVIGDACIQLQHMDGAPNALLIDTQIHAADVHIGKNGNIIGNLDTGVGKALPEELPAFKLLQQQRAVAVDDIQNAHLDGCTKLDPGIPVNFGAHIIHQRDFCGFQVGDACRKASGRQGKITPGRKRTKQSHLAGEHQGQRRQNRCRKDGVIDLVHATACTTDPEDTHAVDVDTGCHAAQEEVQLIGHGNTVIAPQAQLAFHFKDHKVRTSADLHGPFASHDLQVQGAFQTGHTLHIGRQRYFHGGIEANEAAAEQNVVDGQRQRAAGRVLDLLDLGAVALVDITDLKGTIGDAGQCCLFVGGLAHLLICFIIDVGVGNQEIRTDFGAEGDHVFGIAGGDIAAAILGKHPAKLRIAEFHDHTGQRLCTGGRAGPPQHDFVGICLGGIRSGIQMLADIIVFGQQAAVFDGAQGTDTVPDLGACAGGIDLAVNIHQNGLFLGAGIFHRDLQRAVIHIQTVADVDGISAFHSRCLCTDDGGSVAAIGQAEASTELHQVQLHGIGVGKGSLIVFLCLIGIQLEFVGHLAGFLHSKHAVGGVFEGRIVTDREAQGFAAGIQLGGILPVENHLPGTFRKLLIQHQLCGVGLGVDKHLFHGNDHIRSSCGGTQSHVIGGLIAQQLEVGTRQVQAARAGGKDGFGGRTGKGQGIPHRTGTEDIAVPLAQHLFLQQMEVGAMDVKAAHGDLPVLGLLTGLGCKGNGDLPLLAGCQILHGDVVGIGIGSRGVLGAGGVVGHQSLFRINRNGKGLNILGRDIVDLDVHAKGAHGSRTYERNIRICTVIELQGGGHFEIDGDLIFQTDRGVGINAVVGADGIALAAFFCGTHVKIHGVGAVGSQVVVLLIGEIQALVGFKGKDGGSQIVPVTEGHLGGNNGLIIHGGVDVVRHDGGGVLTVVAKERADVTGSVHDLLMLDRVILTGALGQFVHRIILITQCGIHQDTGLDLRLRTGIFHLIGDKRHTVLIGRDVQQRQGLGEGQIIHRPNCRDAVLGGGNGHLAAVSTQKAVAAAKDVILHYASSGHPEGGIGSIEFFVGIQQKFVVIRLFQLISFHRINEETTILFGDLYREISVCDLRIAGIGHFCCQNVGGQQPGHHGNRQKDRQDTFYSFHTHTPFYRACAGMFRHRRDSFGINRVT